MENGFIIYETIIWDLFYKYFNCKLRKTDGKFDNYISEHRYTITFKDFYRNIFYVLIIGYIIAIILFIIQNILLHIWFTIFIAWIQIILNNSRLSILNVKL